MTYIVHPESFHFSHFINPPTFTGLASTLGDTLNTLDPAKSTPPVFYSAEREMLLQKLSRHNHIETYCRRPSHYENDDSLHPYSAGSTVDNWGVNGKGDAAADTFVKPLHSQPTTAAPHMTLPAPRNLGRRKKGKRNSVFGMVMGIGGGKKEVVKGQHWKTWEEDEALLFQRIFRIEGVSVFITANAEYDEDAHEWGMKFHVYNPLNCFEQEVRCPPTVLHLLSPGEWFKPHTVDKKCPWSGGLFLKKHWEGAFKPIIDRLRWSEDEDGKTTIVLNRELHAENVGLHYGTSMGLIKLNVQLTEALPHGVLFHAWEKDKEAAQAKLDRMKEKIFHRKIGKRSAATAHHRGIITVEQLTALFESETHWGVGGDDDKAAEGEGQAAQEVESAQTKRSKKKARGKKKDVEADKAAADKAAAAAANEAAAKEAAALAAADEGSPDTAVVLQQETQVALQMALQGAAADAGDDGEGETGETGDEEENEDTDIGEDSELGEGSGLCVCVLHWRGR
jgi:hypothetical protein